MLKWIGWLLLPATLLAQNNQPDLLIVNGRILDGTGNPWYHADIAIRNGKIQSIGKNLPRQASRIIDAENRIVAPGFIDVHTHIEDDEVRDPLANSFLYDGVTTCITGNCGMSNVDIGKYLKWIDSLKLSINVATLLGQSDVRKTVMGRANRKATPDELRKMEGIVEKAMQDGAMGMSTGLIYIPGTFTPTEELIRLASIAGKYNGVYATHMRDEGDSVIQAIEEALRIGREGNIPVQLSHFKLSGQQNWGRSSETLNLVEQARAAGQDVTIDQYPYTASSTSISTLIPDHILADGQDSIKARLQRKEIREEVIISILDKLKKRGLKHLNYAVVAYFKPDTTYNGKSIEEINLLKGRKHDPRAEAETVMDIQIAGGASAVFHGMGEADVQRILKYPYNMIASDASIRVYNEGVPHPRGYGSNARVLGKYVREEKIISLEEAIRRMTSLPAQKFNLKDRGLLKEGMAADIVVFDNRMVNDRATFEKPHAYSVGFEYVIVNGNVTIDQGKHVGSRSGKALRNNSR